MHMTHRAAAAVCHDDEDRDSDTMVTIDVYRRDGVEVTRALLPAAYFDDNSDNGPFALSPQGLGGTTWDQMRGGWLQISINANGNDTWRFNYSAQLNFSNGRYLTVGRNGRSDVRRPRLQLADQLLIPYLARPETSIRLHRVSP